MPAGLRKVRQFNTENPDRLSAQLSDFEDNVKVETDDIRGSFLPAFIVSDITNVTTTTRTYTVGQALRCNAKAGAINLNLAKPASEQDGLIALIVTNATSNVTVRPVSGLLINNAATKVYSAVGLFFIYYDGANFWA